MGIEVLIDSNAQLVPHFLNWVAANWPGLPHYTLLLGALTHRPLGAGFEDAERVRRQAKEVIDSAGVGAYDFSAGAYDADDLVILETEVANSTSGGRVFNKIEPLCVKCSAYGARGNCNRI